MRRLKVNTIFLFAVTILFSITSIGYSALSQAVAVGGDVSYSSGTLYSVFSKSSNSNYVQEYTGIHQDSMAGVGNNKIYHWYGSNDTNGTAILDKNNVIFANHCWQMVKTTDTGGVKMIYNGKVENNHCLSTRGNHVGYSSTTAQSLDSNYWYGTDYTYNNDSIYYESNKQVLDTAFGLSNCTEYETQAKILQPATRYECSSDNVNAIAYANGYIKYLIQNGWSCHVSEYDNSGCGYPTA